MSNTMAACSCGVRHHGVATETNCKHFRKNNPARSANDGHTLSSSVPTKANRTSHDLEWTFDLDDRAVEVDEFMSCGEDDRGMYLDDRLVLADGTEFTGEMAQGGKIPVYRELLLSDVGDPDSATPDRGVVNNLANQEWLARCFPNSCTALDDGAVGVRCDEPLPDGLREVLTYAQKNGGVIHEGTRDELGRREWRDELGGPSGRHQQYRAESELEMRSLQDREEIRNEVNPLVWPKDEPLGGDEYEAWLDEAAQASWEATKNGEECPENDIAHDYEQRYFRQNQRRWTGTKTTRTRYA